MNWRRTKRSSARYWRSYKGLFLGLKKIINEENEGGYVLVFSL